MADRYIFPFKVMKWDTLATDLGGTIRPGKSMRAIGFIPVYESISELVDDHGIDIPSGTFEALGNESDRTDRKTA